LQGANMKTYYTRVTFTNGKRITFARVTVRDFPTMTSCHYFKIASACKHIGETKQIEVTVKDSFNFKLDIYKHCKIVRKNNTWKLLGLVHCDKAE
jgi:hypothetical protein